MSENLPKPIVEKSPEQKAEQILRIRDKLRERAERIERDYGKSHAMEAGFFLRSDGAMLYNRYVNGENAGRMNGEIKDTHNGVSLKREAKFFDDRDEGTGTLKMYGIDVIASDSRISTELTKNSDTQPGGYREKFTDNKFTHDLLEDESKFIAEGAAEEITASRSASARVLADFRDVLAKRESKLKTQRAQRQDLIKRALR